MIAPVDCSPPQATVLVVEDEPEVADVLEFNLHKAGYQVLLAPDGLTACRLVGNLRPDVILLDVLLPDLEGWEICRMLRSHGDPDLASTPIILLTALGSAEDRVRGLSLGADDYVPKPFSVKEVVLRVSRLPSRRRETRELARRLDRSEKVRTAEEDLQSLLFHELRNKLVVIGGFSRRLAAGGVSGEHAGRYARVIGSASEYLTTLAEQVLLLRKVEAGVLELPLHGIDPADAASAVMDIHRGEADEKGVRLLLPQGGPAVRVLANPLALRVCLSNLVENAVRYGPGGTTVRIGWETLGDRVHVDVEDNGPGIPRDEQARVFERFFRGRDALGHSGSGLGLYVVGILTNAMGARVSLESRVGAGTRFRLQLEPAEAPVPRLPSRRAGDPSSPVAREAHTDACHAHGVRPPAADHAPGWAMPQLPGGS